MFITRKTAASLQNDENEEKEQQIITIILYSLLQQYQVHLCLKYNSRHVRNNNSRTFPLYKTRAMCPAHFLFVSATYWTMSVTLVLCLMMVLRILSFSLTLSIFLSTARWLVSSFFTTAFVRDHVWHQYVIAGKTHKVGLLMSLG